MIKRSLLEWSLLLPVIGIGLLMVRAELKVVKGEVYRVAVQGYDPRDLIHGHYLSIQLDLKSERVGSEDESTADTSAFCFKREDGDFSVLRAASHVIQSWGDACTSVTSVKNLIGPKRYLIPEGDAFNLEIALSNRKKTATVDLIIQKNGDVSMGMLYLDGLPWRDGLKSD